MSERLKMVVGVHLILRQGRKVLLARRFNTGFQDGAYNFPCGHLDPNEDLRDGLIREVREEIGIRIAKKDLSFAGVTHWHTPGKQSMNVYFECRVWKGTLINGEPDKCDDLAWFDLEKLPRKLVPQTKAVLKEYRAGKGRAFLLDMTKR